MCLDGTPAGLSFIKGWGDGINKTLLYFEAAAWSNGRTFDDLIEDLYARTYDGWRGGSTEWGDMINYDKYMSGNIIEDTNFYNWNKVIARYCDGALH